MSKRPPCGLLLAALVLGASASLGEGVWKMRVHRRADRVEEFYLADVESVTFVSIPFAVPPLVPVTAGHFVMGDGEADCGQALHEVTLTHDFLLGQHEVTNEEYLVALQWAYDRGYVTASTSCVQDNLDGSSEELLDLTDPDCEIAFDSGVFYLCDVGYGLNPGHPVVEVRWFGAVRYCDWLSLLEEIPRAYEHSGGWACNGGDPYGAPGYRLPTDAEWEYAAQYDDERIYPWGNAEPDCDRANFAPGDDPCIGWTTEVTRYPAAPQDLGLQGIAGNVWEWCNDLYTCDLGWIAQTDPSGPADGSRRVLRGGAWICNAASTRCAARIGFAPTGGSSHVGFRIARTDD